MLFHKQLRKISPSLLVQPEDRLSIELVRRPLLIAERAVIEVDGWEQRDVAVEEGEVGESVSAVGGLLAVPRAQPAQVKRRRRLAAGLVVPVRVRRLDEHDQL